MELWALKTGLQVRERRESYAEGVKEDKQENKNNLKINTP
jgi:hypothetical protein